MTSHNLRIWAMIQSLVVRCEQYKAENARRAEHGFAQAYGEPVFEELANEIERLAGSFE